MDRRQFVGICAGAVAALATHSQSTLAAGMQDYPAAKLVDAAGVPLKASSLATDQAYLFHYPFRSVPCFLINLGKPSAMQQTLNGEDGSYVWPGGAGEQHNLVAYVAVCTHQLTYPKKTSSLIRYAVGDSERAGKPGMIVCCTHGSVFDPSAGARKISGPAEQPLVPVRLQVDLADDSVCATGIDTSTLIGRFFQSYKSDLIADYGVGGYRQPVGDTTITMLLDEFSGVVPTC